MENGFSSPRNDTFPAGLRVLVVDDDPTWLKILEKMLKKCSYEGYLTGIHHFICSCSFMFLLFVFFFVNYTSRFYII